MACLLLQSGEHKAILNVIRDGSRIDRWIMKTRDGFLHITEPGFPNDPHIKIPVGMDTTPEQERALAAELWEQAKGLASL